MRSPYTQPSRISFLTDDVVDQTTTTTHKFSGTSDAPVDNTAHHADITQSQAAIHHRHTALSNAGNRCKDGQLVEPNTVLSAFHTIQPSLGYEKFRGRRYSHLEQFTRRPVISNSPLTFARHLKAQLTVRLNYIRRSNIYLTLTDFHITLCVRRVIHF